MINRKLFLFLFFYNLCCLLPAYLMAESLTIDEAIQVALDQNPNQRAAYFGVRIADENVGVAKAAYYPNLTASANYYRFRISIIFPHIKIPPNLAAQFPELNSIHLPHHIPPLNLYNSGIGSRYTLFDSGKRKAQVDTAKAQRGEAIEEAERVRQQIILNVYQAYYDLLADLEIEQVARDQLKRSEDHLQLVRQRKEAGDVPLADVYRSEVELANAQQSLTRALTQVVIAKGALNITLGLPPSTCIEVVQDDQAIEEPQEGILCQAFANALHNRPELNASWQRIRSYYSQIQEAKSAFGPTVAAEGAYESFGFHYPPQDHLWYVGINAQWKLFEGFGPTHNLRRARAQLYQEEAQFEQIKLQVQQDVWSSFARIQEAYNNLSTIQTQIKSAQESLRLVVSRYRVGASILSDLLDAQNSLTKVQADFVDAHFDYLMSLISFRWSQGEL